MKTMTSLAVYGMVALTAVTAQNTTGVQQAVVLEPQLVADQIRSVVTDIGVDGAKCGMLATAEMVRTVAAMIREFDIPNLVVDPVMVAKSGDFLLEPEARSALCQELLPLATVITPNLHETEALLKWRRKTISTVEHMKEAARSLHQLGPSWVVVKGGHLPGDAVDIAYDGQDFLEMRSPRLKTPNTHGTGCTYSAALVSGLAQGLPVRQALEKAKEYITWAIRHSLSLGSGHGPTNHFFHLRNLFEQPSEEVQKV